MSNGREWTGEKYLKKSKDIFQLSDTCGYHYAGFSTDSSEGERDVIIEPFELKDYSSEYGRKLTETTTNFIYSHVSDGNTKVADDGYIELTNIMVGKCDRVQPYIDSDELKAMGGGGAINKTRIVALVLSGERRAA